LSIVFLHLPPGKAPGGRGPCRDNATWKDGGKGRGQSPEAVETGLNGAQRRKTGGSDAAALLSKVGFERTRPGLG
jgi:hypothetical protein